MTTEIFNNKTADAQAWITVTKGIKYLTLNYRTIWQGACDYTITYPISAEAELLSLLNSESAQTAIEGIADHGWGPEPIKVVKHSPNL